MTNEHKALVAFLQAAKDGYEGTIKDGVLCIENPDATPERIALGGLDPNLAIEASAAAAAIEFLAAENKRLRRADDEYEALVDELRAKETEIEMLAAKLQQKG